MSTASGFPIGAVVAFCGDIESGSQQNGWYLCDGYGLDQNDYSLLFNVISNNYGSSGTTTFYLPDYQGQFLRGVDGGSGEDPDANSRLPPRSNLDYNGASGSSCGSRQASAMTSEHVHTYSVKNDYHDKYGRRTAPGSGVKSVVRVPLTGGALNSDAAGGAELRPMNQYVNFMIQSEGLAPSDSLQPGIVVAYAGDCSSSDVRSALEGRGWLLCDGRSEETGSPDYSELYAVISTIYGSGDSSEFCVPRYFGQFLRGVDNAGETDPDSGSRRPPRPDLANPGNAVGVGTIQDQGFPSHTHQYEVSTDTDENNSGALDNRLLLSQKTNSTTGMGSGGNLGNESRPKNIALEYLVFYPGATPADTKIPVGMVVAYAGDANSTDAHFDPSDTNFCGWMICKGQSCDKSAQPDLFAAIGYAHGGSGGRFNVPDLQGRFVRGVDHSSDYGLDPVDPGPRQAAADGGNSSNVGSLEGDALHSHNHGYQRQTDDDELKQGNDDRVRGDVAAATFTTQGPVLEDLAKNTGATLSTENRPTNLYVYYLIKA